MKQIISI